MNQKIEALERTMSGVYKVLETSAKQQQAFFERMTEMFNPLAIQKQNALSNTSATSITQENSQPSTFIDSDSLTETINSKIKSAINDAIGLAF